MNYDDIGSLTLKLYEFLTQEMGCDLDEDDDYNDLRNFLMESLGTFVTRDCNWN